MLVVTDLAKEYPTRSGPLPILRGISLALDRGESLAVTGPSGSGKSTLLHVLGTLDRPTRGTVTLDGTDPFALPEPQLADFRNRHVGFIFQDHHLLPQCSVLENVLVPTLVATDAGGAEAWAKELLQRVGLAERLDHRPAELSGGERQRVAVARALVLRPTLLLADEPTGNLDSQSSEEIMEILRELNREGMTIIVVTHEPDIAAHASRQIVVTDGRVVGDRTTSPRTQGESQTQGQEMRH